QRIASERQQAVIRQQNSRGVWMLCDLIDDICDRFARTAWSPVRDRNVNRDAEAQQRFIGAGQWLVCQREAGDMRRMRMHDAVDLSPRAVNARMHPDN